MTCCLSAISRFFDKWNLNGENFAEQFEIWNINSDINFNEDTQILKMSWTIGWNKNHIWLYYNLKTWELSFDNFLAKDPQWNWYIIGKWNWITEKLNIKPQVPLAPGVCPGVISEDCSSPHSSLPASDEATEKPAPRGSLALRARQAERIIPRRKAT